MSNIVQILVLVFLILMNAFFAGSEIAFISSNQIKLKSKVEEGNRKAHLVLKLVEKPTHFLSTIQIGVSLASMLSGAFAADTFADGLSVWVVELSGGTLTMAVVRPIMMIVITFVTMFLMLVIGELVPKRMAMSNPEGFAFFVVYPVYALSFVFTPLVKLLSSVTAVVLKALRIDPDIEEEVTEEEIRLLVEAGEIDSIEKEMIRNVFEFDNHEVADIMTHRTDVIAIDVDTDYESIMQLVDKEAYTRYPVFEDNVDNIIGIYHLRDLLRFIQEDGDPRNFNLRIKLREPYFVPESKRTDELFAELKTHKTHIAVVIDEYGGTAGIVTMEDLIEEVMGNILDEYDVEEENEIKEVQLNDYLVEGYADLDDLNDIIDADLPVDDYDTVSGFMIGELGRLPKQEDVYNDDTDFVYNHYRFSIVEVDEKVIAKIRVTKEEDMEEVMEHEN